MINEYKLSKPEFEYSLNPKYIATDFFFSKVRYSHMSVAAAMFLSVESTGLFLPTLTSVLRPPDYSQGIFPNKIVPIVLGFLERN